jgi:iron complex outermembrane recepter protein
MSELINTSADRAIFRRQLLATVSALALLAAVNVHDAKADDRDADRPTVWIELGGQMENISGQGEIFAPPFLAANPASTVLQKESPLQAQKPPLGFDEEGKISFQPEGSDWIFSAAARIGRSSSSKHVDHQTDGTYRKYYKNGVAGTSGLRTNADYADTHAPRDEHHTILDFSAGKDVGLGMFGRGASSVLSLGVRFAQFTSKATFDIRARPDMQFKYQSLASFGFPSVTLKLPHFHEYYATGQVTRSFHGIGPSLSWNGSAPFIGNPQRGEVTFDWGANASLLFGRQKSHVQHQESGQYVAPAIGPYLAPEYQNHPPARDANRSIMVPNVGGFAGASWRVENFKVSFGYRADFFFGAIDGGIDTRKSETLGFYGPFASVSVGIGG